ncbi:UDP-N-acetyl-D-mannosamine dehydrogenase [Deinococcus irradiatisoli]|uniref:UDP-N-acetyl-D-mannosamine dehydrogenase n=1 Tax=Deinococcus irradiatisoli TaxID=2202254 RepID=A0A2Z3JEZ7_9DEIO|nr:nucleotide sugar dehydrogenase [Deinococcus irradiatisoli]AWN23733.1 UDP-N-acetyl-D-mannosamine dehydrogenase [Deinococcus irradiatisoli]
MDSSNLPTIQIFGLGYIGLPTAAIMSNVGFKVIGVDVVQKVVENLNKGLLHISEPGLEDLVKEGVSSGRLFATMTPQEADVHIIAVPTPIHDDKTPDIDYVVSATKSIAGVIKTGNLVILESTVPPLTCENLISKQIENDTGLVAGRDYHLVHCPERVIPGKIIYELIHNDRIVGGTTPEATHYASEIYSQFVKGKLLQTTATTAEMCKLMENTYRDVNIALANEFAAVAERLNFNVSEAIELANHHPRVNIHNPSIGVGGHCIPVDPWFIINSAFEQTSLIQTARNINDEKPIIVANKIIEVANYDSSKSVALLGLTYKADVDDIRESPAIQITKIVSNALSNRIMICDPYVKNFNREEFSNFKGEIVDMEEVMSQANIIFILVGHSIFNNLQINKGQALFHVYNGQYSLSGPQEAKSI